MHFEQPVKKVVSVCSCACALALMSLTAPASAQFASGGYARPGNGATAGGGRAVGTYTSSSPQNYGYSPGLSPAPGVSSSTGIGQTPGQFFYYNNPGLGYYRANAGYSQFPAFMQPRSLGGGFFQLPVSTGRAGYWRAPSGYYYPWCPSVYMPGVMYSQSLPIYYYTQGALSQAQPDVSGIIADMRQFLEGAKESNRIGAFEHDDLTRRLNEISKRSQDLAAPHAGHLSVSDEATIRRELEQLSSDLSRVLNK